MNTLPLFTALLLCGSAAAAPFQANGIKIGEVDQTSAIIWTRLTTVVTGNYQMVTGSAPGMLGEVQAELWPVGQPSGLISTGWEAVDSSADYTKQFSIAGLTAHTEYDLRVNSRPAGGGSISSTVEGNFRTPPAADQVAPVLFTAVTGQGLVTIDSGANGHMAYRDMLAMDPDFFVHTGDILYYDKDDGVNTTDVYGYNGRCKSYSTALERWHRMFSLGYNLDFHRQIATYYMKDDHDTLKDDCWPGRSTGDLTFDEGVEIFHHQTPSGPVRYRTIRWGKDLQIWLTENREFRSSNRDDDGPNKTIWGAEQKAWFTNTVAASDATFKLLISPGAVVGPDKDGKYDNHANIGSDTYDGFYVEGSFIRQFIEEQGNMYVVCGDRHWQYASIDPVNHVREYCTGAINAKHSLLGGNTAYDPEFHTYFHDGLGLGVGRGGFLSVLVDHEAGQPQITFRWHDVGDVDPESGKPRIAYEETLRPYDFGLVTLTTDHREKDTSVQFMSRMGYEYHIEASTNLIDWAVVNTNAVTARGSLINYHDEDALDQYDHRYYRVVENPAE